MNSRRTSIKVLALTALAVFALAFVPSSAPADDARRGGGERYTEPREAPPVERAPARAPEVPRLPARAPEVLRVPSLPPAGAERVMRERPGTPAPQARPPAEPLRLPAAVTRPPERGAGALPAPPGEKVGGLRTPIPHPMPPHADVRLPRPGAPSTPAGPNPMVGLYEALKPPPAGSSARALRPKAPPPGPSLAEGLRRDMARHRPLMSELARRGVEPTPEGVARIFEVADRYPSEFKELVARATAASRSGDPAAHAELKEAVGAFLSKGVIKLEEWEEVSYVAARLVQQDQAAGAGAGKPVLLRSHKGFMARYGTKPPHKGKSGGPKGGFGLPDWGKGKGKYLKDPPGWGPKGGHPRGDGIQGLHDQPGGPGSDPSGLAGDGEDLGKEALGSAYGVGAREPDIGFGPGISEKGGWGMQGAGKKKPGGRFSPNKVDRDVAEYFVTTAIGKGARIIASDDAGETNIVITWSDGDWTILSHDNRADTWTVSHFWKSGGYQSPEGEGGDTDPRLEPQMIAKLQKEADKQDQGPPSGLVIDPMGLSKGGPTGASGAESGEQAAAAAAAGAPRQKWQFIGKVPGSEVTDPPREGDCPGCDRDSSIQHDPSLVVDPSPVSQAGAKGSESASTALSGKEGSEALASILALLLVNAVQDAGGGPSSPGSAQAETAGASPSGGAAPGPPPAAGSGPSN